jgi:predicted nucleic acid-binding protein
MIYLLDVNVLLALAWPAHVDHVAASRWLAGKQKHSNSGVATCPLTELGFIRLSMQLMRADFGSSVMLLKLLRESEKLNHEFWPETFSPAERLAEFSVQGHKQLNDFFLAELAGQKKGRLATFDIHIDHPAAETIR